MITKNEILKQLECFSYVRGKVVTVHTSLKAVGTIEGGGDTLLDALIEYFTADGGLLCIPTHTWDRIRIHIFTVLRKCSKHHTVLQHIR